MTSSLKTVLLASGGALALVLGAAAAHAGDYEDFLAVQQAAALAAVVDGDTYYTDPISDAVDAAATDAIIDTLIEASGDE